VQHAAIALMPPRRQQHLRLPAITCDKHCNVYNRRLRRSAFHQPTVTSLHSNNWERSQWELRPFIRHASRISHAHSLQWCCLQRSRQDDLLIYRCKEFPARFVRAQQCFR